MSDRTPQLVGLILVLAVVAIYCNMDLIRPGYFYSEAITKRLGWQGEPEQRSLHLREGLDLQGGIQVLLEADTAVKAAEMQQAASIIQNRVDTLGVIEPLVQTQGTNRIVVELPGVTDRDLAVRTVGQTALLEFVYSGQQGLEPGDDIATSWAVERTLFEELPEEHQRPYLEPEKGAEAEGEKGVAGTGPTEEATGAEPTGQATSAEQGDDAAAGDEPTTEAEPNTDAEPSTAGEPTGEAAGDSGALTDTAEQTDAGPGAASEGVTVTEGLTATESVTPTEDVTATADVTATQGVTGTTESEPPSGRRTIYPTVLTGEYLRNASVTLDRLNQVAVSFELSSEGGRRMQRFTADHTSAPDGTRDEFMPITLDGEVISSPAVQSTIATQGQITGDFTDADAEVFVAQLRSGALPVKLEVVGQTSIGPTLGRESVDAAIRGGVVGLIAVLAFMLIYYRLPGFLANLALILYALFVLALFRLIPVTLTLAGIAGFVLSIGMAVDANILIFERTKEELRAGRRMRVAIDTGFSRAWPSIRDSNFSTLITCAILFWFGNQFGASIVKGFAVTLALGVVTSLFTAITVTRTLMRLTNRVVLREEEGTAAMASHRLRLLFGF